MKRKAFTLTEVLIACAILSMFIGGVLTLYSSGSKMSNSTMWLQNINNQLRIASRQINASINKASPPSAIFFPQKVIESKNDCFHLKYYDGALKAEGAAAGKNFLVTTESVPAKTGSGYNSAKPTDQDGDHNGTIYFHIFSLNQKGDLVYTRYINSYTTSGFDDNFSMSIPSGKIEYKATLVRDVSEVECKKKATKKEFEPVEIKITCVMPRHQSTKREETAVGTPNIKSLATKSL